MIINEEQRDQDTNKEKLHESTVGVGGK